jgi:prophage regulatory protein
MKTPQISVFRVAQVVARTGYSRPSIYRLMACQEFPRSVRLGAQAIGWLSTDIDEWIASRQYTNAEGAQK